MEEITNVLFSSSDKAQEKKECTSICIDSLVASMKDKSRRQPTRLKPSSISSSIFRVPKYLHQQNKDTYTPQVISIGPLHCHERKKKLKCMEEHKWRYLQNILLGKEEHFLKKCLVVVKELEDEARKCYSEVILLTSDSFVEMMVLDAYFIIELFRKTWKKEFDDPIFSLKWLWKDIAIDLVKLENQIPFCILQSLFDLMEVHCNSLIEAAFNFFRYHPSLCSMLPENEVIHSSSSALQHLLHLLHQNIVLPVKENHPSSTAWERKKIRCASKLQECGIKFERGHAHNILDIKFDSQQGVIKIPPIVASSSMERIFCNLLVFEHCYIGCKKYIKTYTTFMDCLINGSKDVDILCQEGIIDNKAGNDDKVAAIFNNINRGLIVFESFYLFDVCSDINKYCVKPWPKLRATLMRDYFKIPWAIISFLGAVLLLLLTMTQTFFSSFPKFALGN